MRVMLKFWKSFRFTQPILQRIRHVKSLQTSSMLPATWIVWATTYRTLSVALESLLCLLQPKVQMMDRSLSLTWIQVPSSSREALRGPPRFQFMITSNDLVYVLKAAFMCFSGDLFRTMSYEHFSILLKAVCGLNPSQGTTTHMNGGATSSYLSTTREMAKHKSASPPSDERLSLTLTRCKISGFSDIDTKHIRAAQLYMLLYHFLYFSLTRSLCSESHQQNCLFVIFLYLL